jgi:dihydrofolate reductase
MRNLAVIEFMSLDGVIQSPGSPDEDPDGRYEHGGWMVPYADEVSGAAAAKGMAATDTYLFGRKTYQGLIQHWPTAPDDDPMAAHLNQTPKYVASRTLTSLTWQNSTLLHGEVPAAVAELKRRPGGTIAVLGSAELVRTLMAHDLVDEYRVFLQPIVLGSGKRLFGSAPRPARLRLVECTSTTTGAVLLDYEPVRNSG